MRQDEAILGLETGSDVATVAAWMFGSTAPLRGILHGTAVWDAGGGRLTTLAINEHSPRCHHDFLALNLLRASADAIVTTGKILRCEPSLEHRLAGPGQHSEALTDYRRRILGKSTPPVTLVLTSGDGLDLAHPVFHSWTRPLVYTSHDGLWWLESKAADAGVEVAAEAEPSLRGAIDLLRRELGAATIVIEAGPSTSHHLYDPLTVDHLLLSRFQGPRLASEAEGAPFVNLGRLSTLFLQTSEGARVATPQGDWMFQRFSREP